MGLAHRCVLRNVKVFPNASLSILGSKSLASSHVVRLLVIEHAVGRILELRREPGESVRGAKEEVAMHSHLLLVPELEGDRVFHDFSCFVLSQPLHLAISSLNILRQHRHGFHVYGDSFTLPRDLLHGP